MHTVTGTSIIAAAQSDSHRRLSSRRTTRALNRVSRAWGGVPAGSGVPGGSVGGPSFCFLQASLPSGPYSAQESFTSESGAPTSTSTSGSTSPGGTATTPSSCGATLATRCSTSGSGASATTTLGDTTSKARSRVTTATTISATGSSTIGTLTLNAMILKADSYVIP
ncbi:unnamed protein product [Prorocentrum cordatum]|uniref:Subtilisin n=1 Tax=Prorocentrum cordatum TaxID=2364126 RepID=A0ABN9S377_9DINO|nr:unnamed protein product [Polarella glacialis]